MTENKIFEVRDRATMIPVLVTKIQTFATAIGTSGTTQTMQANKLMSHAGYSEHPLYLYQPLEGVSNGTVSYDPSSWPNYRTHRVAHEHIRLNWDKLEDGAVICVECLEGERTEPKTTDLRCELPQ